LLLQGALTASTRPHTLPCVQVLAADVTFGYHCQFGRLNSVNGVPIMNIFQLARVCDTCTSEFVLFDLEPRAPPVAACARAAPF
jgi:PDZ domain